MLSLENLREFIKKFQTNEKNIMREYIQHLFLSNLYKNKEAQGLLFKGGTALKFIYQSPRFSEDLDFTGKNIARHQLDDLFVKTLSEIEKIGVQISIKEAKLTSGGYLGLIYYQLFNFHGNMNFEVSLRKTKEIRKEIATIVNDFTLTYTIVYLAPEELVSEKLQALLRRRKPRDYYDLYFMLRHLELNKFVNKKNLKEILRFLNKEELDFKKELSLLLPVSHHIILKDFKGILRKEIERHLF